MILRMRPYNDLWDMYGKIGRLFEDEMRDSEKSSMSDRCWTPVTDIYEAKDQYVFKLELPGVAKEDVKVEFEGDKISISGERKEDKEVEKEDYIRVERYCGSFFRSFQLPKIADGSQMKATMKEGILELRIPKREEAKAKAIPIDIK